MFSSRYSVVGQVVVSHISGGPQPSASKPMKRTDPQARSDEEERPVGDFTRPPPQPRPARNFTRPPPPLRPAGHFPWPPPPLRPAGNFSWPPPPPPSPEPAVTAAVAEPAPESGPSSERSHTPLASPPEQAAATKQTSPESGEAEPCPLPVALPALPMSGIAVGEEDDNNFCFRLHNVVIVGVPACAFGDTDAVLKSVAKAISVRYRPDDVAMTSPYGFSGKLSLLCNFFSKSTRDLWLMAGRATRKSLTIVLGSATITDIYINEHLLPKEKFMLSCAKKLVRHGWLEAAWVTDLHVYVRESFGARETRRLVRDDPLLDDIGALMASPDPPGTERKQQHGPSTAACGDQHGPSTLPAAYCGSSKWRTKWCAYIPCAAHPQNCPYCPR